MDSVFSDEAARLDFLQSAFHSYGCAYICLWSYSSSSNRLLLLDGFYDVQSLQTSSSLGSTVDQRLFEQYRGLEFDVTSDGRVPGLAFWNQYSYLELQQSDLLRLAWTDIQRQFFQEARIETAVFIGCHNGEIELGFSSVTQGSEIQTDMQRLFPEELCRQSHQVAHKIPPSSPSPLRSESTGSPGQNTCLLFSNIPGSSLLPEMLLLQENEHEGMANKAIHHHVISASPPPSKNSSTSLLLVQDPPNTFPSGSVQTESEEAKLAQEMF
ncbi:uncharacterized protein LOC129308827 [Prosopis cineraria]|uniref:uncharacterized protein LOC129308827 n=1 Tax=Prosopis cineraria TaxID=364024 RepID=UPI0024101CAD|nr:uncharacterized protein LOC129308827 [Prosopis cineraria]